MFNPFILAECQRLDLPLNLIETPLAETYSQQTEDLIVEALLLAIFYKTKPPESLFYMEIGANHPIQTSNTYLFYRKYGAQGILVEADPELIPLLQKARPRDEIIHAAVSAREGAKIVLNVAGAKELSSVDADHIKTFNGLFPKEWSAIVKQIEVTNIHIRDLLAEREVMYLSVDVEGLDYEILQGINYKKQRPWIISCEPSPQYQKEYPFKIYKLMLENEYTLAAKTKYNMIFIDRKHLK